ncbi:MAG: leucine-rich repeat domain-containing protein, partial [Ruminococcus sp.]|nr:leucine-rich repeat domain-containing protein [Ruminococcus sp.]
NNWNNNACYIDNYLVKINNSEITTCNVLDGTKVICNGAFYNCPNLTSVTIPDSITTLSSNLFSVCPCLTTVSLPSSITTIKQHAFYNCSNLKFDSFPSNLKNIEDKAIAGCKYIGSYNNVLWNYNENNHSLIFIGSGDIVTGAKTSALLFNSDVFNNTYTVSFSDGITSIGKSLFCGFRNLTSVTIPDSITHIGDYAFKSCRNLISLTLPDSVTYIGNWAFFNCDSLKNINIPDSVTSIGKYTFDNCFSLNSIIIPDSVTSIGESAFSNCTSLSSAIIGNDVSTIGARAFLNCPKANIVASDTVRSIGDSAFYHCNMVICPLGSYTYNLLTSDNFTKYRTSHTMVVGIVTAKTQLSYILRKKNSNSVSSSVSKFKISTGAEAKATTGDDVDSDIEEEVLTPEQIADNLSHVQCYVVKDLNINDTLTFDSDLDVTLHLNDYQTDSKGNVKVDSNGNIVDGEVHTISGSSSEALIEVPGNLTISTTGEANGGITNDKGSVFDVKDGGSLTIENGTYSEDVSEYIDDDKVISKTNGLYTVIDPSTEDLTLENDGRQVIMPAGQNTFARNDLTGVQLRAASTSEYDIEGITHTVDVKEGMRFVSVVRSDILRGAVDYGYVLVKGKNVDNMNTRKSDIYVGSDGCVTMSLKGTKNSLANTAYSSANLNEGKYKYLTATVHNIDDDNAAIGARFYIKRADGTYVYADYTCVATMAMLKAA